MAVEIERKFLVTGDAWKSGTPTRLSQGYLASSKDSTVRIRLAGDLAWLTIKGPTVGISRAEFEYEIPATDAQQMLDMCEGAIIEKTRWQVSYENLIWEVDEFFGENGGLVVAEIELRSEDQTFAKPDWVGEEVTDDPRYANSNLSVKPFTRWNSS
ncbi:CYTH domain-containing protein [Litorimonas cladophorae]|uniref:CYTH domain-containing protein n=1 Tax=Litorimonas cladophorae TaxID=1220491 RepID=A0A918KLA2_9PROT|nr:CYTH domain-containing protein [Litorimonas cladophorae]GGX67284.1 CYTH domain-containing protein [Litorimonas cladophorae]